MKPFKLMFCVRSFWTNVAPTNIKFTDEINSEHTYRGKRALCFGGVSLLRRCTCLEATIIQRIVN